MKLLVNVNRVCMPLDVEEKECLVPLGLHEIEIDDLVLDQLIKAIEKQKHK